MAHTQESIDEIKLAAQKITERRLNDDGVDFHREREAEINAMEGVAEGTPLRKAALLNPSEPGLANLQTLQSHQGPLNVHAASNDSAGTEDGQRSAEQANKKGTNTTK
jgi:hypothetical protein